MALEFFEFALRQLKPREFILSRAPAPPLIAYSDAEWARCKDSAGNLTDIFCKGLGGILFDGPRIEAAACECPDMVVQALAFRKTQITPLELLASAGVVFTFAPLFAGRDVIFSIDNQSVCAALCKGASRSDDIQAFVFVSDGKVRRLRRSATQTRSGSSAKTTRAT